MEKTTEVPVRTARPQIKKRATGDKAQRQRDYSAGRRREARGLQEASRQKATDDEIRKRDAWGSPVKKGWTDSEIFKKRPW
jgi:hypothetical protein